VIENLEDTTQRLPIRVHTDGTASVQVRGSKGDTYTLKFGQNDFDRQLHLHVQGLHVQQA